MPELSRDEYMSNGIRVLRRREIENYLWDKEVIRTALQNIGADENTIEDILREYPFQNSKLDDMKTDNLLQGLFERIRQGDGILQPGRNRREFAFSHLAQALRKTTQVYEELREDVFGGDT